MSVAPICTSDGSSAEAVTGHADLHGLPVGLSRVVSGSSHLSVAPSVAVYQIRELVYVCVHCCH